MTFFQSIKQEIKTLPRAEKVFLFFAMLVGFCIAGEYAVTRPASTAIFLTNYSTKYLPYIWLATVPLNFSIVYLYSRFLPLIGPLKMLGSIAAFAIIINFSCAFLLPHFPFLILFQFAWKDVYILLMFKQLWSLIHSTIPQGKAKYLYGLIYGVGTIGSIACSLIPGFFASSLGSENLFLFTLPFYALLFWAYKRAFKTSPIAKGSFAKTLTENLHPREAVSLIKRNKFLLWLLLLVVFMQVSVGLMEYQFNSYLELYVPTKDLRTAYCGRVTGITNVLSGLFQFFGSFLMIHAFGLRGSHLFIPFVLLSNTLIFIFLPSFAMISFAFVFLKAIDFSLFGVIREMLYIPLKLDEKFRAKAIIDVFAHRTSKALISLFIVILQIIASTYLLPLISYVSLAIFLGWTLLVVKMFKQYPMPARESS
jgi:ATP/ADP translocase